MKLSFLSTLNYILFFGLVLFMSTSIKGAFQSGATFEKGTSTKAEKVNKVSVAATEEATETLHSELLFRY